MNTNSTHGVRPRLSFFHASPRGTGAMVMFEVIPAQGLTEGCVMMTMAHQLTVGGCQGSKPVYPTFDMENRIVVKLGFLDIAKMLQVFRGECESIDGDTGLIHRSAKYMTRITCRHHIDLKPGYAIDVYRHGGNREDSRVGILLSSAEAVGLSAAIENSLGVICFGVPGATESTRQRDQSIPQSAEVAQGPHDVRAA